MISLFGSFVALKPVQKSDYGFLFSCAMDPEMPWRWHSQTRTEENFEATIWAGTSDCFLVLENQTSAPIGFCSLYNTNLQHGFSYIALGVEGNYRRSGWPMEAGALLLDFAFSTYRLRKVYVESASSHLDQFASLKTLPFREEGILKDHLYIQGELRDQHILSVTLDDWVRFRSANRGTQDHGNVVVLQSDIEDLIVEIVGTQGGGLGARVDDLDSIQLLELLLALQDLGLALEESELSSVEGMTLADLAARIGSRAYVSPVLDPTRS